MRNVDRSLYVLEPDLVEKSFHRVKGFHESELERQQFNCEFEPAVRCMLADLPGGFDHQAPLEAGRQQLLLKHIFAGDKAEILYCRECRRKLDHVLGALNMIIANGRIEVVETKTGTHQGYDRQIDAPRAINIGLTLSDRHSPWIESDEEIHAIESDPTRLE